MALSRPASGTPKKKTVSDRTAGTSLRNKQNGGYVMSSKLRLFVASAAASLLCIAASAARADGWIGTWGASDVFPVGQDINFVTLRQFVRLSAGGKRVRIRFSNATGQYPLVIGAAHVAKPAADGAAGAIDPASDHALTFGGGAGVAVAPGAEVVSDPVEIDLPPLSTLAISTFVPRWTGPSVIHNDGVATT
jgi:hypothetical protein